MKIIIAGGRDFCKYVVMCQVLDRILPADRSNVIIVSGHANGADKLGERYAKEHKVNLDVYPADWDTFGSKAGPLRNIQMGEVADSLVAFWDSKSGGTKHMIKTMQKLNKPYRVFSYEGEELFPEFDLSKFELTVIDSKPVKTTARKSTFGTTLQIPLLSAQNHKLNNSTDNATTNQDSISRKKKKKQKKKQADPQSPTLL